MRYGQPQARARKLGTPHAVDQSVRYGELGTWVQSTAAQEMARPAPAIDGVAGRSTGR